MSTTVSKRIADELDKELDDMASDQGSPSASGSEGELEELNEEEYEKERLENIKNNAALLDSLGLSSIPSIRPHDPNRAGKSKPKAGSTEERIKRESRSRSSAQGVKRRKVVVEPTRRSGRVAALAEGGEEGGKKGVIDYNEDKPLIAYSKPTPGPAIPKSKAPIIPGPEYETVDGEDYETTSAPLPTREEDGTFVFEGRWKGIFKPNVSPQEMFDGGAFGGAFFVSTQSRILSAPLPSSASIQSLPFTPPSDLLETHYTASDPDGEVNRFKVRAGQSLQEWEKAGWIWSGDPRGWAEWYARFWGGRRCVDDERQIRRWLKVAGPTGRFKRSLLKKVTLNGGIPALEDEEIGAVLRQCLWQWGYELTRSEYDRAMRGDE